MRGIVDRNSNGIARAKREEIDEADRTTDVAPGSRHAGGQPGARRHACLPEASLLLVLLLTPTSSSVGSSSEGTVREFKRDPRPKRVDRHQAAERQIGTILLPIGATARSSDAACLLAWQYFGK
jgi:hypothetical protein